MHIVITTRVLPFHSIGGMQVITWDLAKEFVKKGHKVSCITTSINSKPSFFIMDGIDVIALAGTKPGKHSANWWELSKQYVYENFLNNCDVLLSVSASGFNVLTLKDEMKNTVFVFQGHGTSLSEIASKLRLHTVKSLLSVVKNIKWLGVDLVKYQNFDGIVAAGDRVYKDFISPFYRYFLRKKNLVSIPNGVDTSVFSPSEVRRRNKRAELNIDNNEFVVLVASRIHKQKGILQAVEAFFRYQSQDKQAQLIILGDGPELGNIVQRVKQFGLSSNVQIIGSVSIDQLPHYINAADVFLFTTLHEEGLPLLPLEALASGVPVIVSDHLKEIIDCGDSVIPVNPRNINSIVEGIRQSKSISSTNKSFLPMIYRLDECSGKYLDFFKGLKKID